MRFRSFNTVLDECLLAIQRGESVESCLTLYPRQADRLRPLLTLAATVQRTPPVTPRPMAQTTTWNRLHRRAAELRTRRRGVRLRLNYGAWLRPLATAAAIVLAIVFAGGATALASRSALPDSPLYRVKLATEDARLWFVFNDTHKAEILLGQSDERIQEIDAMLKQGKVVPGNVLSALGDRNERAAAIVTKHPEETDLLDALKVQSKAQEDKLVSLLHQDVSDSARTDYTDAVATVHNIRLRQETDAVAAIRPEDLSGGILNIQGQAEKIGEDLWNVGGVEVRVDKGTIRDQELSQGATAKFVVAKNSRGDLLALILSILTIDLPSSDSVVSGQLEEVTDEGVRLAGQFIRLTRDTLQKLQLKKGEDVEITVNTTAEGPAATTVTAVKAAALTFEGTIGGAVKGTDWTIGGLTFTITDNRKIDAKAGKAQNGARVLVDASNRDGQLLAESVTVLATDAPPQSVYLVGVFEGSRDGLWRISGLDIVPPETATNPDPDSVVAIDAMRDGTQLIATQVTVVQTPKDTGIVRLSGAIRNIGGSQWTLDIGKVRATSTARVVGRPLVGARVLVWSRQAQDGTLQAFYARVLDKTPVIATPAPTPVETIAP